MRYKRSRIGQRRYTGGYLHCNSLLHLCTLYGRHRAGRFQESRFFAPSVISVTIINSVKTKYCVFSYSQKVSKNEKEGRTISLLSGSQQMLFFSFLLCSGDETDQSQSVTVTLIQSHSWQKRETEISQYVKLIWPQKVIYKFLSQQRFIIDRSIILSTCCLKQISSVCNSSEEISSETP